MFFFFYSVHFKPSKAIQAEILVNICRDESDLRFQVPSLLHYKLFKCNMAGERKLLSNGGRLHASWCF